MAKKAVSKSPAKVAKRPILKARSAATSTPRKPAGKVLKTVTSYPVFSPAPRGSKAPRVVIFHAPVEEVQAWARVEPLEQKTKGAQRERKEARVDAIQKFLRVDERNIIPTALIIAFAPKRAAFSQKTGEKTLGTLKIDPPTGNQFAATVVDGQHRLAGIAKFDSSTEVPIIGILDADEVEKAFQFLIINNKSSKVPTTHVKALLANMQETSLPVRLKNARIAFDAEGIKDVDLVNSDQDSPFYQSIDWTTTPVKQRIVQATAIEISLDYMGGVGLPEFEDRDTRRTIFLTIWRTIKAKWADLWVMDSRLISKVGIICLTRFIIDRITNWADSDELSIELTDLAEIEAQTEKIVSYMNKDFWTQPWAEKAQGGFDTNQGRDRVLAAITQLFRNGRREIPWYTDIDIVEIK